MFFRRKRTLPTVDLDLQVTKLNIVEENLARLYLSIVEGATQDEQRRVLELLTAALAIGTGNEWSAIQLAEQIHDNVMKALEGYAKAHSR